MLKEEHGWPAGTIAAQLGADATLIPFGMGAIFVPAMTRPLDEPLVSVWAGERRVAQGTTGRRLIVEPGTYSVRLGSGSTQERFHTQVKVRELHTSVVPVSWAGMVVHVVDENLNSVRQSYEIIRVENREYIGTGYGVDEQAGESLPTWMLRPGLYKIVRVGETYRARRDFATVRLADKRLTHFLLVVDEETGDFKGAGEVMADELFQDKPGALRAALILGGDANLSSNRNVLGAVDGETYAFRAFVDAKLGAQILDSPLILRLQIEEGMSKLPDVPWQTSDDRIDLDGLYVYKLRPWIGPYLHLSVETNALETRRYFDSPQDVNIFDAEGSLKQQLRGANNLLLRGPLGLTNIEEGSGLNLRLLKVSYLEMTTRVGVGARHRLTGHLMQLTSEPDDPVQAYQLVSSINRVGVEGGLLVVARISQWAVGVVEVDGLVPIGDVIDTVVKVEGNLAIKITEYVSINYVMRYLRDNSLSRNNQLEHDLRLRFSFQFL
ncbi:MAG: hypothetical protein ABIJ09_01065 [Pseudomonadota bacterium]